MKEGGVSLALATSIESSISIGIMVSHRGVNHSVDNALKGGSFDADGSRVKTIGKGGVGHLGSIDRQERRNHTWSGRASVKDSSITFVETTDMGVSSPRGGVSIGRVSSPSVEAIRIPVVCTIKNRWVGFRLSLC